MALPLSRDVTFAAGSQVPSATLNSLQDGIIERQHGSLVQMISAEDFVLTGGATYNDGSGGPVASVIRFAAGSEFAHCALPFPDGTSIDQIAIYGEQTVTADAVTAILNIGSRTSAFATGSNTTLGTSATTGAPWSIVYSTPFVINVANVYKIRLASGGATATVSIMGAEITFTKP